MAHQTFLERSRHYLAHEYPAKIRLAVTPLSDPLIWKRANDESNSIGNLLLHLSGNVGEWIVGGIGRRPNERHRAAEFAALDGDSGQSLLEKLDSTVGQADDVLSTLTEGDLGRELLIQGRRTTVLGAVYHVVEHFSMHTGQIILLAKLHSPGSVRFYEDAGGLAVPLWGGTEGTG